MKLEKKLFFLCFKRLQQMAEVGILSRLQKANWPVKKNRNKVKFEQISISQIVQIHFIWIIGTALSLIILLLEIQLYNGKYKHRCGIMCSKKLVCQMEKFVENHSTVLKIVQDIAFAVLIISVAIFIVYVF